MARYMRTWVQNNVAMIKIIVSIGGGAIKLLLNKWGGGMSTSTKPIIFRSDTDNLRQMSDSG